MSNQQNNRVSISDLTCYDVLTGRGRSAQSHLGNINYRKLVFVNKGLYDSCPILDKVVISRGIVAAVRVVGGRFLKFDKKTDKYYEMDDHDARMKTSQALRDAHSGKISEKSLQITSINSKGAEFSTPNSFPTDKSIPKEAYFGYSLQVLQALFNPSEVRPDSFKFSQEGFQPASAKEAERTPIPAHNAYAPMDQHPIGMTMHHSPNTSQGAGNPPFNHQVQYEAGRASRGRISLRDQLMERTSFNRTSVTSGRPTISGKGRTSDSSVSITEFAEQFFGTSDGEDRYSIKGGKSTMESTTPDEMRELMRLSLDSLSLSERSTLSVNEFAAKFFDVADEKHRSSNSSVSISEYASQFFDDTIEHGEDRPSNTSSVLTQEIRELIRCSDASLRMVDEMDIDDLWGDDLSFSSLERLDECDHSFDEDLFESDSDSVISKEFTTDEKRASSFPVEYTREVSLEDEDQFSFSEERRSRKCLTKRDTSMRLSKICDDIILGDTAAS